MNKDTLGGQDRAIAARGNEDAWGGGHRSGARAWGIPWCHWLAWCLDSQSGRKPRSAERLCLRGS